MIVQAKDVRFSRIEEKRDGENRVLVVEGLVFHSSLAVSKVDLRRIEDAVTIEVYLTPTRRGLTGNFTVQVPLDDDLHRVLFGSPGVQIWPTPQT